jgi:MurNAc alpha-1-phosphate uridylyltransferase
MPKIPPVMIFAAGFGTRMRPLTLTRPKPLIEVAGQTLLDHALAQARAINPPKIVVNAHYLADQIVAHCADMPDVQVLIEAPEILDTGGGLKAALNILNADDILSLNADMVWHGPLALQALLNAWSPAQHDALLLMLPRENAVNYTGAGDFVMGADGRLTRGPGMVFSGAQRIKSHIIQQQSDTIFSLNTPWNTLIKQGFLAGTPYGGTWCDVGNPGGIKIAESLLNV